MHVQPPQLKNQSGYTPARWPAGPPLRDARHSVGGCTNAFTLVELIAVIAIIGILMALLLPVVGEARRSGKVAKARNEIKSIKNAIDAYFGEYGKMPARPAHQGNVDRYYGGGTGTKYVIEALIGIDAGIGDVPNARKIAFLEISTRDIDGTFLDPWGNQYKIQVDTDYNNGIVFVNNGNTYKVKSIVWSMGEDETNNTGDDILSVED